MTFRQVFVAVYLPLLFLFFCMGIGKFVATGRRPNDVWFYLVLLGSPALAAFTAWLHTRRAT